MGHLEDWTKKTWNTLEEWAWSKKPKISINRSCPTRAESCPTRAESFPTRANVAGGIFVQFLVQQKEGFRAVSIILDFGQQGGDFGSIFGAF